MTPPDERDRELLLVIDQLGPASPHTFALHPIVEAFDTYEELALCVESLTNDGYLRRRTIRDVRGDSITEYDTLAGWEDRLAAADYDVSEERRATSDTEPNQQKPRRMGTPAAIAARATHPDPDHRFAAPILTLTAGDRIGIHLVGGHTLSGTILKDDRKPPSELFDTPSQYRLLFEASGVRFQLTLWYRDRDETRPRADAIDLRLVEGREWSIPITPEIEGVRSG